MSERFANDPAVPRVLAAYGVLESARLGAGGEASVFALDGERVLRVHRPGPDRSTIERRASLLDELGAYAAGFPFGIPRVLAFELVHDRWVTVEPRFPGSSLAQVFKHAVGPQRESLVRSYLDAGRALSGIPCGRPFFGELLAEDAVRADSFGGYLEARARRSLSVAAPLLDGVDAGALARALPEPERQSFVYLDYYPDNVLVEGDQVTAVVDFGGAAIAGEPRFGSVVPAVYLGDADAPVARAWLEGAGLSELYEPVRRWLAAFWSFARDDERLFDWCRRVLLDDRSG